MTDTLPLHHARYRVENTIGQGGMGTILRAYDRFTDTWVALKQILLDEQLDPATGEALRAALAAEFRLLATLRHPYIVSVLDYGFAQNAAFFTMEYLAGATPLTQATAHHSWAEQLQLLGQLLQALEYVRRHGVVHRDLKPANVLVQQGQVKMLDFGLATIEGQRSTTAGSLLYMAPEVFNEFPLTHATDLYAVGVMAYEMLAGHHPFAAKDHNELLQKIFATEPDYTQLAGPEALRPVVARLLAKDPAARYATAHEVLTALVAASGLPLTLETQATRASLIQAAQLVGREAELMQLNTTLQNALQGRGQAVLVGGESGVGKSRLLEELRIRALTQGAQVWPGQAITEGGVPAQLWRTILRWLALTTTPNDLEAGTLKPFVPDLETLLDRPVPDAPPLEAKAAQDRFCSSVLALLRQAAAQQPVVLLLEDVQWAGPLSRAVLAWVMRAVNTLPLLIIATYRNDEQPNLPMELPPALLLPLARLGAAHTAALASAIFGLPAAQLTALSQFLYQQTEGNTFFVVETLRSLAAESGLLQAVQNMALPERLLVGGIQAVVQHRLQRLSAADYAWLETAAVMGRELDLPLLRYLGPTWDWAAWLNRCAEAAVLEPQSNTWRFAHDQLRQAVLGTLTPARHQALHLAIAQGLEQVYRQNLQLHLNRLLHHYAHTELVDKQRHYLTLAAQVAQAAHDYARALTHYAQLTALGVDPSAQMQLNLQRGTVLEVLGQWPEAAAAYQAVLTQATQQQDLRHRTLSQKALGVIARWQGEYATANHWFTAASEGATASQDLDLLAKVQAEIGLVQMRQGNYAEAQAWLEKSLTLARAQNDLATTATALGWLGKTQASQGQAALAQKLLRESLSLRQAIGDKPGIAQALNDLANVYGSLADYANQKALHEASLALRREIGEKVGVASSLNNLGYTLCLLGEYATAYTYLNESLTLYRQLGDKPGSAYPLGNLGLMAYRQGTDYAAAARFYAESVVISAEVGNKPMIQDGLLGMAAAYAALKQMPLAMQLAAAAENLRLVIQFTLGADEQKLYEQTVAAGRAALSPIAFDEAWAMGMALTLEAAVAVALTVLNPNSQPLESVS